MPIEKPKAEQPKETIEDFSLLASQPDYELAKTASKLSDTALAHFSEVNQRFHRIAQAEFKTRPSWLWKNGEIIQMPPFHAHEGFIISVFVMKDGNIVSVGSEDHHIYVWQWDAHTKIYKNMKPMIDDVNSSVQNAVFLPAKNILALLHNNFIITVWDVDKRQKISQFDAVSVSRLALSPDGKIIATTGPAAGVNKGIIDFWNIFTGEKVKRITAQMSGYHNAIWSIAFSPDGKQLATEGSNEPVKVWNVETLAKEKQYEFKPNDEWLLYLPDGKLVASSIVNPLLLWDVQSNKQIVELKYKYLISLLSQIWSHDFDLLAGFVFDAHKIIIWHRQSGSSLCGLDTRGFNIVPAALSFSSDDKMLGAGTTDGNIIVWKAESPKKQEAPSKK